MTSDEKFRVLVVDDSAYNRQTLANMLESIPHVEVVGRAMNGKEALKLALDLSPDVITLDLEMPEMDGFAFLRLLMNKRPTPVVVVSGYSQRENVFRALELGALDFVAKPGRDISPDLRNIESELVSKIELVRRLASVRLRDRALSLAALRSQGHLKPKVARPIAPRVGDPPDGFLGIAASTGGPPAIQQLLCSLPSDLPLAVMISQHMPARFTKAFADRLNRIVEFDVREAMDGDVLSVGRVLIAPGAANLEVDARSDREAVVRVVPSRPQPGSALSGLAPSADHMLGSMAEAFGARLCALVLTGMGSDGREGAKATIAQGGRVLVEDPDTAVMPGMPYSVIEARVVSEVLPLERMADAIVQFAESCRANEA